MITGFNTDIEYQGVIYHVQTEDKGLESPIILSLVYSGGAILASKRSPYEDLIREGFSDEALAERLKRQHKLICAAIHTGRLDDLKKMSGHHVEVIQREEASSEIIHEPEQETIVHMPMEDFDLDTTQKWQPQPISEEPEPPPEPEEPEPEAPIETLAPEPEETIGSKPKRPIVGTYRLSKQQPVIPDTSPGSAQGLRIRLLDEVEFYAGDAPTLRVLVTNRDGQQEDPISNAAVSVKVLGTTFRPLIYTLKTQRDGIAKIATQIPQFTSGRAAVLVRATAKEESAELRCIIHPKR